MNVILTPESAKCKMEYGQGEPDGERKIARPRHTFGLDEKVKGMCAKEAAQPKNKNKTEDTEQQDS